MATTAGDELEKILLSVDNTPLDPDDLFDVKCALIPVVAAKWRAIGEGLGLKGGTLDVINKDHPNDAISCMGEVASEWLKKNHSIDRFGQPTWRKLVEMIGRPVGGNNLNHARKIAQEHPSSKVREPPSPIKVSHGEGRTPSALRQQLRVKTDEATPYPYFSRGNEVEQQEHNLDMEGVRIIFFSQGNFGGSMYIYTADNTNVNVFPRGVGSAKVEGSGVVTLYQMSDYRGVKALLLPGEYKDQSRFPVESGFIKSLQITKHNPETENVRVTFFSQGNFGGYMYIYTADSSNITEDFPNGVGSAKVAGKPPGGAVTLYQMSDYEGEKALLLPGKYADQSRFPFGSAFVKSVRIGLY